MSSKKRRIGVVPVGEVPEITSKTVAAHILGYLDLDADVLPPLEHPAYAHDEKRLQYNAATILQAFDSMPFHDYEKVIGVLEVDLFIPIFTHVFGEAKQGGRCGLVSLYRLKKNTDGSTPPMSLLLERAGKVALHELGHLYNLYHCMDTRCLMHFSGEIEDLDKTPLYFCRYCSVYFRHALSKLTIAD
jgi:archaemetzincin